jgi:hypothetical protein
MTVPDGAQLSEDGRYWWDGADWQPVPEGHGNDGSAGGEQPAETGQLSEDGQWKWDGSEWQPVDGGHAAGGAAGHDGAAAGHHGGTAGHDGAAAGGDLAAALAQKDIPITADAADAGYIQQAAEHLSNWYGSLDENSRAIVDALSKLGGDALLADPEVAVVNEGDPLVTAFAMNDKTLNESLQATNQALEQTAAN